MKRYMLLFIVLVHLSFADGPQSMPSSTTEKPTSAQLQSDEEMAAIKPLLPMVGSPSSYKQDTLKIIHERALRAWTLNPQNEPAGYYACQAYAALVSMQDIPHFIDSAPQAVDMINRYLNYFGEKDSYHYYRQCISRTQVTFELFAIYLDKKNPEEKKGDIYKLARNMIFSLTEQCVWELRNPEQCMSTSVTAIFGWHYAYFLPNIPSDKLEYEFNFWRSYYDKVNIDKLLEDYKKHSEHRWGPVRSSRKFLEAAYYAKMQKVEKAKEMLEIAAKQYSSSDKAKWGGEFNESISKVMQMSGNTADKNWRPANQQVNIEQQFLDEMTRYFKRNIPSYGKVLSAFSQDSMIIPVRQLLVPANIKNEIISRRQKSHSKIIMQPLGEIDGITFFVSHNMYNDCDAMLFTALKSDVETKGNGGIAPEFSIVGFPVHPDSLEMQYSITDYLVRVSKNQQHELWIATARHGICVLYRNSEGNWDGYWYGRKSGLPEDSLISAIYKARYDGSDGVLVACRGEKEGNDGLYFINPESRKILFIKAVKLPCKICFPDHAFSIVQNNRHRQWNEKFIQTGENLQDCAVISNSSVLESHDLLNASYVEMDPTRMGLSYYCKLGSSKEEFIEFDFLVNIYDINTGSTRPLFRPMGYCIDTGRTADGMFGLPATYDAKIPVGFIHGIVTVDDTVIFVTHPSIHHTMRTKDLIYIWKPNRMPDKPLTDDRWYGPFTLPSKQSIVSMTAGYGKLWAVDTDGNIWDIDIHEALAAAKGRGKSYTSDEWNKKFSEYLKRDWRLKTFYHVGRGELREATDFLDSILSVTTSVSDEYAEMLMFKAAVYSQKAEARLKACDLYLSVLDCSKNSAVRYFAKKNLAAICFLLGENKRATEYFKELPVIPDFSASNMGVYSVYLETLQGSSSDFYLQQIENLSKTMQNKDSK